MQSRFSFWRFHFLGLVVLGLGPLLFFVFEIRNPLFLGIYGIAFPLAIYAFFQAARNTKDLEIKKGEVFLYFPIITRHFVIREYTNFRIKKSFLTKSICATYKENENEYTLITNVFKAPLEEILKEIEHQSKSKDD